MTERALLEEIVRAIYDRKGKEVEAIEVSSFTTLSDYFVICTGSSSTHIRSIAEGIEKHLKDKFLLYPHHTEGYNSSSWILLDYSGVLVNVFLDETRKFYSLERLWGDGISVDLSAIQKEAEGA